jgi:hypothetical protein
VGGLRTMVTLAVLLDHKSLGLIEARVTGGIGIKTPPLDSVASIWALMYILYAQMVHF